MESTVSVFRRGFIGPLAAIDEATAPTTGTPSFNFGLHMSLTSKAKKTESSAKESVRANKQTDGPKRAHAHPKRMDPDILRSLRETLKRRGERERRGDKSRMQELVGTHAEVALHFCEKQFVHFRVQ